MSRYPFVGVLSVLLAPIVFIPPAAAASCESLASLSLPDTTIASARSVSAGEAAKACGIPETSKFGITLVNRDPGPSVIKSASAMARRVSASGLAVRGRSSIFSMRCLLRLTTSAQPHQQFVRALVLLDGLVHYASRLISIEPAGPDTPRTTAPNDARTANV